MHTPNRITHYTELQRGRKHIGSSTWVPRSLATASELYYALTRLPGVDNLYGERGR